MARAQSHVHIFMRVHTHAWLKSCQKKVFVACVSRLSISPSPFSCVTRLCCSCTLTPTSLSSPSPSRTFPSYQRKTCATPHMHREVWPPGQVRCKHMKGSATPIFAMPMKEDTSLPAKRLARQQRAELFARADAKKHSELESLTTAREGRCHSRTHCGKMARDCTPGSDRVVLSRAPHEPLSYYPLCWLCCLVEEGHFSLGHQR